MACGVARRAVYRSRTGRVGPVACASTPTVGGFYIGRWESFVAEEFVEHLVDEYDVADGRVSLVGSSMGGYGR
ncbi:hypothetical protein Val02_07570 [Virgisporangium aliadipatigenens]|uniref:Alpha/beta hydrolase n=1 Tax=Virgisporangium aliadipatigenens TaxID=741659 RepID=A0A8J4DNJ0_9ACTN|nr:alpha/beta hydrolase-fold protein [Virgisporangium aliadipatigenens]GIJ43871.1 hypothetical protein Val02_07570 [Virgisporangium aliadipatigenens]